MLVPDNTQGVKGMIFISKFMKLSLQEYCEAHQLFCQMHHVNCSRCLLMIQAAQMITDTGLCTIKHAFTKNFPQVTYNVSNAKRLLLQMPLAALCINEPISGKSQVYVTELIPGVDYVKMRHFINIFIINNKSPITSLSKDHLRQVLSLAQCDRERELIKYTAFCTSGLSQTAASKQLGLHNMSERAKKIEQCILDTEYICECVHDLSKAQDKAIDHSFGIPSDSDPSDFESDLDLEHLQQDHNDSDTIALPENLLQLLQPDYNWFNLVHRVIESTKGNDHEESIIGQLEPFYMEANEISDGEKKLLKLSHETFVNDWNVCRPQAEREAETLME